MSGETEEHESGWTVDTLRADMLSRFSMLRDMLDERYATQTKALDAAFIAQQAAVEKALASQEKAVGTAQASAERASLKSDLASEKRFDSVNEFRAQQGDIIRTFMPRSEAESIAASATARIKELAELISGAMSRTEAQALSERNAERIQELTNRLNRAEGQSSGEKDNKSAIYAFGGLAVAVIVAVIVVLNFVTK
jgi:hypothetical protein